MPHTHHSHSGQFCGSHAQDELEAIIQYAISRHFTVFALTEHMPRHDEDRYPNEIKANSTLKDLQLNEAAYVKEALRMREKYKGQLEIPIGFEGEWIRPESEQLVNDSIQKFDYDFFIGSVHYVHQIPIDYTKEVYQQARQKAGGTDERLFEDYFDAQFEMLKILKPPVIGHMDLIRLLSDDFNVEFQNMKGVWKRVQRNLDFIAGYGGILEINSAAVRKGMLEPYPKGEICKVALNREIRFCLSDDSHGIGHVAACYDQVLNFLDDVGIRSVVYLTHAEHGTGKVVDERFPGLRLNQIDVNGLRSVDFWQAKN
jgi:histidinol-phosphatase (PHP family)